MIRRRLFCLLALAFATSCCLAQNITDVETKPYGSYTGGAIDTIDLATGNLTLNIPLVSFPQRGSLPPLAFSIEANNAPYSQTGLPCDPSNSNPNCALLSSRYDTAPPGGVYQYTPAPISISCGPDGASCNGCTQSGPVSSYNQPNCTQPAQWGSRVGPIQNAGVYLASSYQGGIVTGQEFIGSGNSTGNPGAFLYTAVDGGGSSHVLASDATSWNTYRAPDGSGYTFIPTNGSGVANNGYDVFDPANYGLGLGTYLPSWNNWLTNPVVGSAAGTGLTGVRIGTLYSPTGITYSDSILAFPTPPSEQSFSGSAYFLPPRALQTTIRDTTGNTVTRGPWYWSGYWSLSNNAFSNIQDIYSQHPPEFIDSVGRTIPDVVAMQSALSNNSIAWNIPGQDGNQLHYAINYQSIGGGDSWTTQGEGIAPDPSTDVDQWGLAISSVVLPNNTRWSFTYSGPDLMSVTNPSGGTISYTYTSILPPTLPQFAQPLTSGVGLGRCNAVCHAVQTRTETDGLGNAWVTTYSYGILMSLQNCPPYAAPGGGLWVYAFYTTETDPNHNDTVHMFCGVGMENGGASMANRYHEIETDDYEGSAPAQAGSGTSGRLLKTVQTTFEYQPELNTAISSGLTTGIINILPNIVTTTIHAQGTTVSTTDVKQYSGDINQPLFTAANVGCSGYCLGTVNPLGNPITHIPISYNAPIAETIKDAFGNQLKTTSTVYEFQNPTPSYMNKNMIALPLSGSISGWASGTTTYAYDENNGSPQGTCGNPSATFPFGNETSKTSTYYMSAGTNQVTSSVRTQTIYDCNAMPTAKIDGNGNSTNISYDSTGLFASAIQRPSTGEFQHKDYYLYDLNTGNLKFHTDENGSVAGDPNHTTRYGYDVMGRITSISYPDGGGSRFCYTDIGGSICNQGIAPFSLYTSTVTTTDPTQNINTTHTYDGWGRQYFSSVTSDPQGPTIVNTSFDFAGRVASVSSPHRTTTALTDGVTSFTYDALGRKTIQRQPDDSAQHPSVEQWCYDGIATTGQTNCQTNRMAAGTFMPLEWTDSADETGRDTQQAYDVLGQMGSVVDATGHETDYKYDVFGDLGEVDQYSQPNGTGNQVNRYFYYDMPGRVTMACNPETKAYVSGYSNCLTYSYDSNSNLKTKTDGRHIVTQYAYDALNRLLSKTYSSDLTGTASSCFQYDGGGSSNLSGRLLAQWTQTGLCSTSLPATGVLSKSVISLYDAMGRVISEQRCTGLSNCAASGYAMTYSYDLAGKLISYPAGPGGFSFANSYDSAGRLLYVNGISPSQGTTTLFSVPSYTPAGGLSGVQLGSSVTLNRTFDSRQRVTGETDTHQ